MAIKDFYYSLEEKFHQSIDSIDAHVPVRWFTDAIDKVIPSFILINVLILAIIVFLIVFFAIPHTQTVNFVFKSQNTQLIDSFGFTFNVDGTEYTGNIEKGLANVIVKKGKTISLDSLDTKEYKIDQKIYDFSENLTVILDKVIGIIPVSLFLFNEDGSTLTKSVNLTLSCSSDVLSKEESQKTVSSGNATVNVPETCGTLNISGQIDGYNLKSGNNCDSSACSIEFSPITQVNANNTLNLPNGGIKVIVNDDLGLPVNGAKVKIYDISNLRDEIDLSSTNAMGITKVFSSLPVGKYSVYVSYIGYKDSSIEVNVNDNSVTDAKLSLQKLSLGTVSLEFKDSTNNSLISGSLALKDSTGKIIYRGTTSTGNIELPVYNYGSFLLDFKPDDANLFPIGNYALTLDSTTKDILVVVKPITKYDNAKINISVTDEDGNPVEGAKIFVRDGITNYDLISFDMKDTDSNGYTSRILPKGVYSFRAYTGFAEAVSEVIAVLSNNSGDIPEINVNISLPFGYSMLNIHVKDEYGDPMPSAKVTFYKKPLTEDGTIVTDVKGNANHSFKAGVPLYFTVEADNYQTYYSESRILMNNYIWDANISMEPFKLNAIPRIDFLGLYETIGGKESKAIAIGNAYYIGFRLHIYDVPEEKIEFRLSAGDGLETVEKEKLYFIDSFTSANSDFRFSAESADPETYTLGDTKVFKSIWNNPTNGTYDIYYKVQVRNDSSVKLYDPLTIKWDLTIDGDSKTSASDKKEFLAGTKTICAQDSFCGRYTLLDKTTQLYVDPLTQDNFMLSPGNQYELNFDLINGIDGPIGELKSGILQIYNAISPDESLTTVKNNISTRSFIESSGYKLSGPNDEHKENSERLFGSFVEDYSFVNLIKNRYISGNMQLKPVIAGQSYLNFVVIDNDRKIVVQGKPATSLNFNAISERKLNIVLFPDRVLVPNLAQTLKVFVKDDSNSNLKDAFVSVRLKKPTDNKYFILNSCRELITGYEGSVNCNLSSDNLVAGSYLQVIVTKDGYAGYSRNDLTPDLQVSTKLFSFDKDQLNANLIYPIQPENFDSVVVTNNSASDVTIDHLELELSNYNQDTQNFLNVAEMKNYTENINKGKVILGRQLNFDKDNVLEGEAKTNLENVFKAALNEELGSEIDTSESVSGALTFYFKTDKDLIKRVLPFSVKVTSDGFPTNASDCLIVGLMDSKNSFASDGGKIINIPLQIQNQCRIITTNAQGNNVNIPVSFDNAYIVLNHDSGALGLGNYTFSIGQGEFTNMRFSVPSIFANDWQQQDEPIISNINFTPRGTMGKENLKLKIIAQVKTSEGIKKVESKEIPFSVSVMNISDCIKVFNDKGEEFDQLDLPPKEFVTDTTSVNPTGDTFEITIKNICEGLPLTVQICKDNNSIPKSCGEVFNGLNTSDYTGFKFDNVGEDHFAKLENLEGERKLIITRPSVSGAYALEIFAQQPGDFSFKRIKFLPVNVQTTSNNYLFVDDPYLLTYPQVDGDSLRHSDPVKIYNTDIPGSVTLIDPTHFESLLSNDCDNNDPICLGDLQQMIKRGEGSNTTSYSGGVGNVGQSALGATTTIVGTAAIFTGLIASGAIASTVPGLGWIVGGTLFVAGTIGWVVNSFTTYLDDTQRFKFILINNQEYPVFNTNNNEITGNGINYYDLFKISGQDKYQFVVVAEDIKGYVGCEGYFCGGSKYWTDRIEFDLTCPVDYEIDPDYSFEYLKKGMRFTNFNDCWWDKEPTVNENTVTFYPKCGGNSFTTVGLQTYAILPCRLKSELWGRSTQGGIQGGYPNAGMFYVKFNNLDFDNFYFEAPIRCDAEWCYKTYPVNVDGGILGPIKSAFRFAFKNPKPQELSVIQTGQQCSDISGNVIGFTGPDAKPKVSFNWNLEESDIDFCTPDENGQVKQYCDSTQFMISNLYHIQKAQEILKGINDPQCTLMPKIVQPSMNADENTEPKYFDDVAVTKDPDTNDIYLQAKKDLGILSGNELLNLNYKIEIATPNETQFDSVKLDTAQIALDIYRVSLLAKKKIMPMPNDFNEGLTGLFDKSIILRVSKCYNNDCVNSDPIQINYSMTVWSKEQGCVINNPSTAVPENTGKMIMFSFYPNSEEANLFEVQDLLHYKAYLMQDGYTQDFLNDFQTSIDNGFLPNLGTLSEGLSLRKLISENRIKIVNDFGESKTLSAGLYGVHVNIVYPKNSLDLQDSNILIVLNKIKSAVNDNIFYYMPIDGKIGIEDTTIDRQGYGVDFSGDTIVVDEFNVDETQLLTNYSSNSTPISHLNINTSGQFSQMNGSERGTIFNAKRNELPGTSNVSVLFIPDLQYWKVKYNMANNYQELETILDYSLFYNDEQQYGDNVVLPWYVLDEDVNTNDFSGQLLIDNYPRTSSVLDSTSARISYDSVSVTNKESYNIFANVFGKAGSKMDPKVVRHDNLSEVDFKTDSSKSIVLGNSEKIETLNDIFQGIEDGILCITKSSNNLETRVFVNEEKLK